MVINVIAVPGNGQYQPEGGLPQVPQFTLSMDEGFALKERLDRGEKVVVSARLEVPPMHDIQTEYTVATLDPRTGAGGEGRGRVARDASGTVRAAVVDLKISPRESRRSGRDGRAKQRG